MKLKSKVFVSAMILTSMSSFAQTKLVVAGKDGSVINTEIQKISEITFSEAGMTIVSTDGSQTVPLADVVEMSFDASQNGVSSAAAELGDIKISMADGLLTAATQGKIKLTVYNLQGQPVASVDGESEVSFDFQSLTKGIYIVNVNNKIIKVTR